MSQVSPALRIAALKSAVITALGTDLAKKVSWAASRMPTIVNVEVLREWKGLPASEASRRWLLEDVSFPTALEAADGNWAASIPAILAGSGADVLELVEAYDQFVGPSRNQPSSRMAYWHYWRACITWGIAWGVIDRLIPMTEDLLRALTFDLLQCQCSPALVVQVWSAVQQRHRIFRLPPPVDSRGEYMAWRRSIGSIAGRPRRLVHPVSRDMVAELLGARPSALRSVQDKLITVVGTIACLRPSEVAALQVCDVMFDFHVAAGGEHYRGTAALRVIKRKNDSQRKGHFPVLGKSEDPRLRVVFQLRRYMELAGLRVSGLCGKGLRPAARCLHCPPLFPRMLETHRDARVAGETWSPCTRQMVTNAVRRAASSIGRDGSRFSAVSMRKGGISVALEAGVPEEIIFLQSGHGLNRPGRRYMALQSPKHLYDTFRAFSL